MSEDVRDAGYDDLLDAIAEDRGYYLECPNGHGSLPPRTVCPTCGDPELAEEPLVSAGQLETWTLTTVATPDFEGDAPYVLGVASFGPVRLTGQVRGVDEADVETGLTVEASVENRETTDEPLLVFRPH
jgi:uncharacterized OB-fold protein